MEKTSITCLVGPRGSGKQSSCAEWKRLQLSRHQSLVSWSHSNGAQEQSVRASRGDQFTMVASKTTNDISTIRSLFYAISSSSQHAGHLLAALANESLIDDSDHSVIPIERSSVMLESLHYFYANVAQVAEQDTDTDAATAPTDALLESLMDIWQFQGTFQTDPSPIDIMQEIIVHALRREPSLLWEFCQKVIQPEVVLVEQAEACPTVVWQSFLDEFWSHDTIQANCRLICTTHDLSAMERRLEGVRSGPPWLVAISGWTLAELEALLLAAYPSIYDAQTVASAYAMIGGSPEHWKDLWQHAQGKNENPNPTAFLQQWILSGHFHRRCTAVIERYCGIDPSRSVEEAQFMLHYIFGQLDRAEGALSAKEGLGLELCRVPLTQVLVAEGMLFISSDEVSLLRCGDRLLLRGMQAWRASWWKTLSWFQRVQYAWWLGRSHLF